MKRREFIKGGLAIGVAAMLPKFASKKERMGMAALQKLKIKFTDGSTVTVKFSRFIFFDDGTIEFYALAGTGTTEEILVLRVSPHNYLWMKPVS